MKFCSFICEHADNDKAQHAACLAVNGVYCALLEKTIEKGSPCAAELAGKLPVNPPLKKNHK
jgi:hypothetical protein